MFQNARLKLTAWYLVIIMAISVLFSFAIYSSVNVEFRRFERFQERINELQEQDSIFYRQVPPRNISRLDPEMIGQARTRFIIILGGINIAILGIAGGAGYFLAGRTLKPIQKMMDEQNRFIADASHELRTPLTSLRSEIEVNLRKKDLTLKDSKKLLESNLEEVVSLQSLSDSLLELAQTEKPANTSNFVQVSIKDCIDNAVKKLEGAIREKQIFVKYYSHPEFISGSQMLKPPKGISTTGVLHHRGATFPEGSPSSKGRPVAAQVQHDKKEVFIFGIPDRITELFVILLDNAIKYGPAHCKIKISVQELNEIVEIKIIDNGIGIEETDLPFVFDRFYRASKSRSKEHVSGYGLGLSIAKKIVEIHHGTIAVDSKINKGTTFTVYISNK